MEEWETDWSRRDVEQLQRENESYKRNIREIADAIGDKQIVDAQLVKRLLNNLLPIDMKV